MKNDKLIVGIASLLKMDKTVIIENLEKEDGDDGILKEFREKYNVFSVDDVATLNKNAEKTALEKLEKADEFPKAIYNRVKGLAFEKAEKSIAKKHGIDKWDSIEDLSDKIATKGKGVDGDEKDKQIVTLKQSVKDAEAAQKSAVDEVTNQFNSDFINRDLTVASTSLKVEGDDEETVTNQKKLIHSAFKSEHKLTYKEGKTIVLDSNGETLKDKLGDPQSLSDVYTSYAISHGVKIKQKDPGGRGDGSSGTTNNQTLKGKSFHDVRKSRLIDKHSAASDELFKEWTAQNPKEDEKVNVNVIT